MRFLTSVTMILAFASRIIFCTRGFHTMAALLTFLLMGVCFVLF